MLEMSIDNDQLKSTLAQKEKTALEDKRKISALEMQNQVLRLRLQSAATSLQIQQAMAPSPQVPAQPKENGIAEAISLLTKVVGKGRAAQAEKGAEEKMRLIKEHGADNDINMANAALQMAVTVSGEGGIEKKHKDAALTMPVTDSSGSDGKRKRNDTDEVAKDSEEGPNNKDKVILPCVNCQQVGADCDNSWPCTSCKLTPGKFCYRSRCSKYGSEVCKEKDGRCKHAHASDKVEGVMSTSKASRLQHKRQKN
jgi:hypothetical protein